MKGFFFYSLNEFNMISLDVPGYGVITIKNLVLDFNGTMAVDGVLVDGVEDKLKELADKLDIYVISADTYGSVGEQCSDLPVTIQKMEKENQKEQKRKFVKSLIADVTCSIGNGNVDVFMLRESVLSIVVMGHEACSGEALKNADLLVPDIHHALDLLLKPTRLIATLRR